MAGILFLFYGMSCRNVSNKKLPQVSFYNKIVFFIFKKITEAGSCWTSKGAGHCVHGRCVASEDGSTFSCQCDPGYSGQFCTDSKSCYSSSSSLSLLYSNKSRFVRCVTLKNKKKRQEENGPMKNHCPTIYE